MQLFQQVVVERARGAAVGIEELLQLIVGRAAAGRRVEIAAVAPVGIDRQTFAQYIGVAKDLGLRALAHRRAVAVRAAFRRLGGRVDVGVGLVALQHHVAVQGLLNLQFEVEARQLQQPDGLLQGRRHRQGLAHSQTESGLHVRGDDVFVNMAAS